ncbi:MAG TPA: hypothetical protein VHC44_12795 [Verrucomicrobiae bacterium]|nr:hypothetical protein [Verrucomicrobiae bacterium]
MKNSKLMMVILSGLLAIAAQGFGQNVFQVTFKGTCVTTNVDGAIVSQKLNNKSLIQDAVIATGATNSSHLAVVYVQNASSDPSTPGDFIEVVDTTTGTSVYTNLLFLYGGPPFTPALISADQTRFAAGAQVIPLPLAGSGDSLGGATINGRLTPKKTLINGSFNYVTLRSPTSTSNDVVKVCSGSFNVNKAFTPK